MVYFDRIASLSRNSEELVLQKDTKGKQLIAFYVIKLSVLL